MAVAFSTQRVEDSKRDGSLGTEKLKMQCGCCASQVWNVRDWSPIVGTNLVKLKGSRRNGRLIGRKFRRHSTQVGPRRAH